VTLRYCVAIHTDGGKVDDRVFHESAALALRQNIASLVYEAVRQTPRAVLLWLWDPEWRVYVLNRHAPRLEGDLFPQVLRRRIAGPKREGADALDAAAWLLSIGDQEPLRRWAEPQGLVRETFFAVWRSEGDNRVPLAFMHVLTGEDLNDVSRHAVEQQLVGVGATIVRSRGERQLDAVAKVLELQVGEQGGTGETAQQRWLTAAAQTLTGVTRARACAVFRPGEMGRWESVVAMGIERSSGARFVAAADGAIARAGRTHEVVRAYDVASNPATRGDAETFGHIAREFGGGDAFSCLVVPVVFAGETLVVFVFVNKRAEFHLAEAFTTTDQEVVNLVAQLLAGVMPRFQLYEAVERASLIGAPGALDDAHQRADLFAMMQRMLPQVVAAAIVSRRRPPERLMVRMLGGDLWFETAEGVAGHLDGVEEKGRISLAVPIANVQSGDAYLALQLRSRLTMVDRQVLSAFRNELSHALHAEASIRAALDVAHQTQHALRAPLMLITGELHAARARLEACGREGRDAAADPGLRSALEKAHVEAERLREAMNGPRFFLADIHDRMLKKARASLLAAVDDVCSALTAAAARRRIRFEMERPDVAEAVFDRELLYHALFNVLDNAVKYAAEDSVVRVGVRRGGAMWEISVENEGSFVAPEDRERIFDAFVRKPDMRGPGVLGTGLGLAVTRAVVEAHGGRIRVESESEGGGARTRFILSLSAEEATLPFATRAEHDVDVRTVHHLDDEPATVQWIGPALRDDLSLRYPQWQLSDVVREGETSRFTVRTGKGEIAIVHRIYATLEEFRECLPQHAGAGDMVLIDVMTEDENGVLVPHGVEAHELAEQCVAAENVYFLTGYPRGLLAGVVPVPPERVLSKPVDIDAFLKAITRSLRIDS
jgi:signal transduction histidine kinase